MKGELFIENARASFLARKFGTPLYVYSSRSVLGRLEDLQAAFRNIEPMICYAFKANSNRALASLLARRGAGAEVVSGGELSRALAAGFPPSRIVFSGVGKTREEMSAALRRRILLLHVESSGELEALEGVARRLRLRAPLSVRLNPDIRAGGHAHIETGREDNKFGVGRGEALALYRRAARSPWLAPRGLQCHVGSQITALGPFLQAARAVTGLLASVSELGIRLAYVDLGGGFGVRYQEGPELNLEALGRSWERALRPWPESRLIIEPGRYLVAEAGTLLAKVLYTKDAGRRHYVIVDAGMNDLARPALYGAWHPVSAVRPRKEQGRIVDIVGPVCETGDFLALRRRMRQLRPGDLVAVGKVGAYGFSMSSNYNSRLRPAEVLVEGSRARLVRRRETMKDLVRGEIP